MNVHRDRVSLDGWWDFAWLGDVQLDGVRIDPIRFNDTMPVPGCFDALPALAGQRGVAAYRTTVHGHADRRSRLVLDGVHHACVVFVEGRRVGSHDGGFVRFATDLGPLPPRSHELVVLVDNRFDAERCPLHREGFDWYHHGGIARPAWVEYLPTCWVERVCVTTLDHATRRVRVELFTAGRGSAEWSVALAGVEHGRGHADAGDVVTCEFNAADLTLWSCEDPHLHTLTTRFGDDAGTLRVGLRTVRVGGGRLLLNGRAVQLRGVCRHELHPETGHAVSDARLHADLHLLRKLGVNFVRGAHYPQHPAFLELCDRHGLLVWSEGLAWNTAVEQLTDPRFLDAHTEHLTAMVAAAQHHPCIILWGVFNEGHSHEPAARPAYEAALAHLRALDPSRPVTFATNRPHTDRCLDLADVIAINTYPGWYDGSITSAPGDLDRLADHLDAHPGLTGKPRLVSEIGAGALYGWRDPHGERWTEDYQARLLRAVLPPLLDPAGRWNGVSIWQFSDVRTSPAAGIALGRPRCFNNKGLVDEHRRAKQAFDAVAELFHAASSVERERHAPHV